MDHAPGICQVCRAEVMRYSTPRLGTLDIADLQERIFPPLVMTAEPCQHVQPEPIRWDLTPVYPQ